MKYFTILFIVLVVSGLVQCSSSKEVAYEFPAEMKPAVQIAFAKQCEKGEILYAISCAKCHVTEKKGKKIIPDYTAEQLEAYKIRVLNSSHENHLAEDSVSAEELGLIMTFLSYKKKN